MVNNNDARVTAGSRIFLGESMTDKKRAHHYFGLVRRVDHELTGIEQAIGFDELESEYSQVEEAMAYFAAHDPAKELEMAIALGVFWDVRGYWWKGKQALEAAIGRQQRVDTIIGTRGLTHWAGIAARQDDLLEALKILDRAEPIALSLNDLYSLAHIARLRSNIHCELGRYPEAHEFGHMALKLGQQLDDDKAIAGAYRNLAWVGMMEGRYSEAKAHFERSYSHHEKIENLPGMATALNSIGTMQLYLGTVQEAKKTQERAFSLAKVVGFKNVIACCYVSFGRVAKAEDQPEDAIRNIKMAIPTFQAIRNRVMVAYCFEQLGKLTFDLGQFDRAARCYSLAARLRHDLGSDLSSAEIEIHGQAIAVLKEKFPSAWQDGSRWPLDEAITFALAVGAGA